jgi:hypothetical protein
MLIFTGKTNQIMLDTRKLMLPLIALSFFFPASVLANDTTKVKILNRDAKKVILEEVGSLPKILKEASGLTLTGNHFWSHNDDGIPALYCLDSAGHLLRAVQLNVQNKGWEDLAQDQQGNVYIGGFGNNKNDRRELRIYKIPSPESITAPVTFPEIISYHYADQKTFPPSNGAKNFDVDAFIAYKESLLLFTKNRTAPFTGYSKVYKIPQAPGTQEAVVIDSIFVGTGPMINFWITGAAISPDQHTIALLFHDHVWLIKNFANKKISQSTVFQLNLNHYSHKAGITFRGNDELYIVDEFELGLIGGKLYRIDLKPFFPQLK